jgi:hypothetical protein
VEDNHHPIQLNHLHIKSQFDIHDHHANKNKIIKIIFDISFLLEQIQQAQDKYFVQEIFQIVFWHHHSIIHVINHINLDIVLLIDQMV